MSKDRLTSQDTHNARKFGSTFATRKNKTIIIYPYMVPSSCSSKRLHVAAFLSLSLSPSEAISLVIMHSWVFASVLCHLRTMILVQAIITIRETTNLYMTWILTVEVRFQKHLNVVH
jgi:hypothetical protein